MAFACMLQFLEDLIRTGHVSRTNNDQIKRDYRLRRMSLNYLLKGMIIVRDSPGIGLVFHASILVLWYCQQIQGLQSDYQLYII